MGKMKCPDCGREMSDRSVWTRCPSCGCPMEAISTSHKFKMKLNKCLWGLSILFFLFFGLCHDDKEETKATHHESTEQVGEIQQTKKSRKNRSKAKKTKPVENVILEKDIIVSEPMDVNAEEIISSTENELKEDLLETPTQIETP